MQKRFSKIAFYWHFARQSEKRMKKPLITLLSIILCTFCYAQPLKLEISNPQPRVGESFTISVEIDTLSELFFKPLDNKFKISGSNGEAALGYPRLMVNAEASKTGKNVVGPYTLEFNGKKYTTNKLSFEIVDSLPRVDKGLWIRKAMIDDTTFCILIDQRRPSHPVYTHDDNSLTITSRPDTAGNVSPADSIENIKGNGSTTTTGTGFLEGQDSENEYSYFFGNYRFVIIDKKKPTVLHRSNFKNLPPDYKFEDIVVN